MSIQSSANNYFRTAAQIGIQQKVESRRAFDLPGGIALWKAVAKVMLWSMPFVLGLNLFCSAMIQSQAGQIAEMKQALAAVESSNIKLRTQKAQLASPDNVMVAAAEKLSLYKPVAGQIQRM